MAAGALSQALRERWVHPYYLRILHLGQGELGPVLRELDGQRHAIGRHLVLQMLAEFDWRPRIVAALLAALSKRFDVESTIGRLLLRSDVCYAGQGYCLALASFNTSASSAFLEEYLDYYLQRPDLWFEQAVALAALHWLDTRNGSARAAAYSGRWQAFVRDKKNWALDGYIQAFGSAMSEIDRLQR